MKATGSFKKTIMAELTRRAANDPLFAQSFSKPYKDIDQCIIYILKSVQASGMSGFDDNEIFNMAVHYYDEDSIDVNKPIDCKTVINHHVELTEEEIAEAKAKAIQDVHREQRSKMLTKNKPSKPDPPKKEGEQDESPTLF